MSARYLVDTPITFGLAFGLNMSDGIATPWWAFACLVWFGLHAFDSYNMHRLARWTGQQQDRYLSVLKRMHCKRGAWTWGIYELCKSKHRRVVEETLQLFDVCLVKRVAYWIKGYWR